MVCKRSFVFLLSLVLFMSFAFAFEFNGTTYDANGQALNATINVTMYDMTNNFAYIGANTTVANATGWFNLTVPENSTWMYSTSILYYNYTNANVVSQVGQSLPYFPSFILTQIAGTGFYLKEAGTINISAVNSAGTYINFTYQIKDQKLGYIVADNFADNEYVYNKLVYLPRDRNYSIMIFPFQSMPVSTSWTNFSANASYTFANSTSHYNATSYFLNRTFNMTMSHARVNGYINLTNINGLDNLTVIAYMLEPGNMAHATYGTIPYNLSSFFEGPSRTDFYNLSTIVPNNSGFYNISVPTTVETSEVLLFAVAQNGSSFWGGFHNISLDYYAYNNGSSFPLNFTNMFGLLGENATLQIEGAFSAGKNVSTKLQTFNINTTTNLTLTDINGHIEVNLDYSDYGVREFTFMANIDQGSSSSFSVPLLNVTGVDQMNVYVGGGNYEPISESWTVAEINADNNITLSTFNPGDIDGGASASSIYVSFYLSNATCDVPNPADNCIIGNSESMESFDPMAAIFGGGKISFRMGLASSGIEVHYVDVDMLASGPPSALFDNSVNTSTSGDFESAMRFGSNGPTIYDFVLISIPYTEGSSSTTGLNESRAVNMTLPVFYDEDWNVIWNQSINGSNGTYLGGNDSHYEAYADDWHTLMQNNTCISDVSIFNATNPCYINTTANKIWIRLPHFSGTSPQITGEAVLEETSESSSSGGGGGGGSDNTLFTYPITETQLENGHTQAIRISSRFKIKVNDTDHYIKVKSVNSTTVVLNITSDPIILNLNVGDEEKVDVDFDGQYDLKVKLVSIVGTLANINVIKTTGAVPNFDTSTTDSEGTSETGADTEATPGETDTTDTQGAEEETSKGLMWVLIFITFVILVAVIFFFKGPILEMLEKHSENNSQNKKPVKKK